MHRRGGQLAGHVVAASGNLGLIERGIRRTGLQGFHRSLTHPRPHQAKANVAHHVHEVIRSGQSVVRVLHAVLHEIHTRRLQILACRFEWLKEVRLQRVIVVVFFDKCFHHLKERHHMLAAILGQLTTHQIKRLHAVGTLIDHRNTGIAGELGHAPFLNITVSAINLLRGDRIFKTLVGQKALNHRGHQ